MALQHGFVLSFWLLNFSLALCFVAMARLWLHDASWWCSRNPLMSGEDTPKISQHGFSDGKKWHCSMDLCFLSDSWILVWRYVLLSWQGYDCMMPHDGVVVIRWCLVKILQKLASMDFLMARNGIAAWICDFLFWLWNLFRRCFLLMVGVMSLSSYMNDGVHIVFFMSHGSFGFYSRFWHSGLKISLNTGIKRQCPKSNGLILVEYEALRKPGCFLTFGWISRVFPYFSRSNFGVNLYFGTTPHPVTVTTKIIPFLVGNRYQPSFVTVTGWGVDQTYTFPPKVNGLIPKHFVGTLNGGTVHLDKLYGYWYGLCKGKPTPKIAPETFGDLVENKDRFQKFCGSSSKIHSQMLHVTSCD